MQVRVVPSWQPAVLLERCVDDGRRPNHELKVFHMMQHPIRTPTTVKKSDIGGVADVSGCSDAGSERTVASDVADDCGSAESFASGNCGSSSMTDGGEVSI